MGHIYFGSLPLFRQGSSCLFIFGSLPWELWRQARTTMSSRTYLSKFGQQVWLKEERNQKSTTYQRRCHAEKTCFRTQMLYRLDASLLTDDGRGCRSVAERK